MNVIKSYQRIPFYLMLLAITITSKNISQELPKDYEWMNIAIQRYNQDKEFQHLDKKGLISNDQINHSQIPINVARIKNINNTLFPQSEIYVIDTAIVRSTTDTTRQIYSYYKNGKINVRLYQRLSNIQWVNAYRDSFIYNEFSNLTSEERDYWVNNLWSAHYKMTSVYDVNGNLLSELREYIENNLWTNDYRITYTYDSFGNQLSILLENWLNNQWVNYSRTQSSYNTDGDQILSLYELWTHSLWVNKYQFSSTYDAHRNQLTYSRESWADTTWMNDFRFSYTYDTEGNQLTYLYEQGLFDQWKFIWRYTSEYDSNRNKLSYLYEKYLNNQWVLISSDNYTYDASGNMTLKTQEGWQNNQWTIYSTYNYTYDANGNLLLDLQENFNEGQLVSSYRHSYKYFQNKLWNEGVYDIWQDSKWIPQNTTFDLFKNMGSNYSYNGCIISLSYNIFVTKVRNDEVIMPKKYSLSQNFPNPFNPTTTIAYHLPVNSYTTLRVYDVLGKEVKTLVDEQKMSGNHKIEFDAKNISSGVYFYTLHTKEFTQTKKLILIK